MFAIPQLRPIHDCAAVTERADYPRHTPAWPQAPKGCEAYTHAPMGANPYNNMADNHQFVNPPTIAIG